MKRHQRCFVRHELSWLYSTFGLSTSLKFSGTAKFLRQAVEILCSKVKKFKTAEDLLDLCKVDVLHPIDFTPVFACPRGGLGPRLHLKKVFKALSSNAIDESDKMAVQKIDDCFQLVNKKKMENKAYQPLLLRMMSVVYSRLSQEARLEAKESIQLAAKQLMEVVPNTVRIVVIGDGYDRTLLTEKEPRDILLHPPREALAPFELVRHNEDVFLLSANVTRLWDYLPDGCKFLDEVGHRVAELYGSVFTAITPQKDTKRGANVMIAKEKLAKYIQARQAKAKTGLVIDIVFAGIGFTHNGEGPNTVLSDFAQMYRAVTLVNLKELNTAHKRRCAGYLGVEWTKFEKLVRKQHGNMDFCTYITGFLHWPKPKLPSLEDCEALRFERIRRLIVPSEVDETPTNPIMVALAIGQLRKKECGMDVDDGRRAKKRKCRT